MKQKNQDNLIYLAVGLGIVAFILADLFYADGRSQQMWWPSKFASRAVYTTVLLAYFVARETRALKFTLVQVLGCVLLASVVHLAIIFGLRHAVDQLSGMSFSALAVFEVFIVLQLLLMVIRHLRSG